MRYLAILILVTLVGACSAGDTSPGDELSEGDRHLLQDQQEALEKAKAAAAALESAARRTEEALEQD